MAAKKKGGKKKTHRKKKRKGLFGIGAANGAAERIVGGLVGAGLTRMVMRHVDDDRTGNIIALLGGGFVAWTYPEGFVNGLGIGAMAEATLNLGECHFPWMRGISDAKIRSIEANVAKMKPIKVGGINVGGKPIIVSGYDDRW